MQFVTFHMQFVTFCLGNPSVIRGLETLKRVLKLTKTPKGKKRAKKREKKEIFKGNFKRKFQQQNASLFGGVSPPEPPKKNNAE